MNSLEQLCINFANELLQSQFNEQVFVLEKQLYAAEGIEISNVTFSDNSAVLLLLEGKPSGIFSLLEEQGRLGNRATPETFRSVLYQVHAEKGTLSGQAALGWGQFGVPRFGTEVFSVKHFAGEITYDPAHFLSKNIDELHIDMQALLASHTGGLIATMRADLGVGSSGQKGAVKASVKGMVNLTAKFQAQMKQMMTMLTACEPRRHPPTHPAPEQRAEPWCT